MKKYTKKMFLDYASAFDYYDEMKEEGGNINFDNIGEFEEKILEELKNEGKNLLTEASKLNVDTNGILLNEMSHFYGEKNMFYSLKEKKQAKEEEEEKFHKNIIVQEEKKQEEEMKKKEEEKKLREKIMEKTKNLKEAIKNVLKPDKMIDLFGVEGKEDKTKERQDLIEKIELQKPKGDINQYI